MIKAGVVGSSGYIGEKLLQELDKHPAVELCIASSTSLTGQAIGKLQYTKLTISDLSEMDVVFLAVPHGKAKDIASHLNCNVIDLSADHRLTNTYGLPEINKLSIAHSKLIANPGCYATACILSVYPIKEKIQNVVFDCISGYSGGGKNHTFNVNENIIAYKLTDHFHKQEMSKVLGIPISFTPHVVNTFSGIMCTAHIFLTEPVKNIRTLYKEFYKNTKIVDHIPTTKEVVSTSNCIIGGFDQSGNEIVIISVVDNLLKGAVSQAIENMEIMCDVK